MRTGTLSRDQRRGPRNILHSQPGLDNVDTIIISISAEDSLELRSKHLRNQTSVATKFIYLYLFLDVKLALRINREDDFYDQLYNLSNILHILIVTTQQLNFGHREFSSCVLLSRFELRRYILVILWGHSRTLSI